MTPVTTTGAPRAGLIRPSHPRRPIAPAASSGRVDPSNSTPQHVQGAAPEAMVQRRQALQVVLAGIAAVSAAAPGAARAGDASERREGEIHFTDAEWRVRLTPDSYAVLRTAATERRNSSPLVEASLLY